MKQEPVLTPTEARQATPTRSTFRVLILSLFLAVFAAGAIYYAFYETSWPERTAPVVNSSDEVPADPA